MAGGGAPVIGAAGRSADYNGKLTGYVIMVAIVAASGGLLFGYDLGVTGGVESMDSFLSEFFPEVYEQKQADKDNTNPYCTFNDDTLSLFTSSLFLAGLFMALVASQVTRWYGRRISMLAGGLWFLAGGILNAAAQNTAMLIVGRIFLGFGIGFANSTVPLYLSEMAPFHMRGAMNIMFQLATTIGILVAQLVNYGTSTLDWGWRLSLGLAIIPAIILTLGGIFLPESPNSLIERGHKKQGRAVLEKIRGTSEVDAEYEDICDAAESASKVTQTQAWKNIFCKREYRPSLVLAIMIPLFQQWTGINAIMFYVPVLFSSLGSSRTASLLNAVIIGAVNLVATFVSIYVVDRAGRRVLFLEGGVQMLISQVITGVVLAVEFGKYNTSDLPSDVAIGVLVVICVFVAGFAWSWGPLGWLVPSEIQPLETRAAGFSLTTCVNFLFSFVLGQAFLPMLCAMEWGVFIFFAGMVAIMTVFVYFLVPETRGVPLEEVYTLYAKHKFWSKVVGDAGKAVLELEETRTVSREMSLTETGRKSGVKGDDVLKADAGAGADAGDVKVEKLDG